MTPEIISLTWSALTRDLHIVSTNETRDSTLHFQVRYGPNIDVHSESLIPFNRLYNY